MRNFWRYELDKRFDPYHDFLKQALRTTVAAFLGMLFQKAFSNWNQAYWAILMGVFLTQTRIGDTDQERILSVLICGLLSTLLAIIALIAANSTLILVLYYAFLGAIVVFYSIGNLPRFPRVFFVVLFALISGGIPVHGALIGERVLVMLIGTGFSVLSSFLWLETLSVKFHRAFKIFEYTQVEFVYRQIRLVLSESPEEKKELRLSERRNRSLRQLYFLRNLAQQLHSEKVDHKLNRAERLWKLAVGFGNLRYLLRQSQMKMRYAFLCAEIELNPYFTEILPKGSVKKMPTTPPHYSEAEWAKFYISRFKSAFEEALQDAE